MLPWTYTLSEQNVPPTAFEATTATLVYPLVSHPAYRFLGGNSAHEIWQEVPVQMVRSLNHVHENKEGLTT